MPLTPVTSISRFVSVGGHRMALITRYKTDFTYTAPAVQKKQTAHKNHRETWANFLEGDPDSLFEYGSFENALREIGDSKQITGAAVASPQQFAEMLTAAYDLGRLIAVASVGRLAMGDLFKKPQRFTKHKVVGSKLKFFTWRGIPMYGDPVEPPGIYRNVFSLSSLEVTLHELEEPHPTWTPDKNTENPD